MQLKPFLLDDWLDRRAPPARYNLGASTGPVWTLDELQELMTPQERAALGRSDIEYGAAAGRAGLREELAAMHGVSADEVQVTTGGAEGLLILFFLASEAGANLVVPEHSFETFTAVPTAMGCECRPYRLRQEDRYRVDVEEIKRSTDDRTQLIVVNSPHSPTGSVIGADVLKELHDFAADRGVQLVVDEVFHPIYHDGDRPSAAHLPQTTIVGDFSKGFCLGGLRVGWIIDRNVERIERYRNARAYFTASNSFPAEALAEVAARDRETVWARARGVVARNLPLLDQFFQENAEWVSWVRPEGGFTGFPRLLSGADSRPFAEAAARNGVLVAPGDCFGCPSSFRLGFGRSAEGYNEALQILGAELEAFSRSR